MDAKGDGQKGKNKRVLNEGDLVETPIKTVPDYLNPPNAPLLTHLLKPDLPCSEECHSDACNAEDLSEISLINCSSQENVQHGQGQTTLYMYRVIACCADFEAERVVHRCQGCLEYLKGLNRTAFSLLSPLPDEVLNTKMGMVLREKEDVECVTVFLGKRSVSDSDLHQMQRFHRGILCWETDEDYSAVRGGQKNVSHFISSIPTSYKDRETAVIPPDEWAASGGNSWYCLLPLSDDMTGTTPRTSRSRSSNGASDRQDCTAVRSDNMSVHSSVSSITGADSYSGMYDDVFADPVLWSEHLKECADEAQILSHNLRMQRLINIRATSNTRNVFGDSIQRCSEEEVTNMLGKIVTKGAGGLFLTAPTRRDAGHLTDVMKIVKEMHVTSPMKPYESAPCSCCAPTEDGEEREVCVFVKEAERAKMESGGVLYQPVYREVKITYLDHMSSKYPEYRPFLKSLSTDQNHIMLKMFNIADKLTLAPLLGTVKTPVNDTQRAGCTISASQKLRDQCCPCRTQCPVDGYPPRRPAADFNDGNVASEGSSQGHKRGRVSQKLNNAHKDHIHAVDVMLAPEFCRVIGEARWYFCGLSAPSVIWRVQSLLLAVEARDVVVDLMDSFALANPTICSPMGSQRDYRIDLPGDAIITAVTLHCIIPVTSSNAAH